MNRGGQLFTIVAIGVVIGLPFLLRNSEAPVVTAEDTVVIITPHTESIRYEFSRGFASWYEKKTGRSVYVDYRVIGGTSEISKFLDSQYTNSFRNHWEEDLKRDWTLDVQGAFNNPQIEPDESPEDDSVREAARRAYLASNVSSGIDVFFGGGTYDFSSQAAKGALVNAGIRGQHPEWFIESAERGTLPEAIPQALAGEEFFDKESRWYGAVLSSYGIIYNRDALEKLGIQREPRQWEDLANPAYFGQIAVCDPTKSGAMTQAFEMILQQQMQIRLKELQEERKDEKISPEDLEGQAVREGWMTGMRLIQKISANARYFTDSSQKPNIDVGMGDCAAGMSIDFYGRFQQENILDRSNDPRFGFHTPVGGSTVSADPIGLLRGAENEDVARMFIEFVLSLEGQKLWNFDVGTPGGPQTYSLRRPPIRPELYSPELNQFRSDSGFNPYLATKNFIYRRDWTGRLFSEIRTVIRICFIDVRKELVTAWSAIIRARDEGRMADAARAEELMQDLAKISYDEVTTTIDAALKAPRIEEVRLSRELSEHFRQMYLKAARIADGR
jgi:iron(III) transport system substrate-binding protein